MVRSASLCLAVALAVTPGSSSALAADPAPLLVVLTDGGSARDGLPVLVPHPAGKTIAAQLERGFSGEILHVYRDVQTRLHRTTGSPIEPAYLFLSNRQGGFARYGFYLGGTKKAGVPYVDVHRSWDVSGRLGSVDQIFPHELAHAIFHQLKIEPGPGDGANQVHAIGVRTDRFIAFDEGFAEHLQIMALEHPDAAPATRELAQSSASEQRVMRHLEEYRRELTAWFAPAPRMLMSFPLWYSNDERALRYFAVRRNAFAREPVIPPRLLSTKDRYRAYLLENVLPGDPAGAVKPVARMIESEGVVSALFYRWATDPGLQRRYRDDAFYGQFGTSAGAVSPLRNVYLKLFHAMEQAQPHDVIALIDAYKRTFPDEAPLLDAVTSEVFLGQRAEVADAIWLANPALRTGTSLFDQFRGAPLVHTFDLNAASIVDLTSMPGVTPELARVIQDRAPYRSVDDLAQVPGVSGDLVARMKQLTAEFERLAHADADQLTMSGILLPYLWRFLGILAVAGAFGAILYLPVARRGGLTPSALRLVFAGLGAALAGVIASWFYANGLAALAAAAILFGLPAAAWQLFRKRSASGAVAALAAWAAAAIPAAILTTAWF